MCQAGKPDIRIWQPNNMWLLSALAAIFLLGSCGWILIAMLL